MLKSPWFTSTSPHGGQGPLRSAVAMGALVLVLGSCGSEGEQQKSTASEEAAETRIDQAALSSLADDSIEVLGIYDIDPDSDELVGEVPAEHRAVFTRFAELIGPELRPEVTTFVAIDSEASDGTDGALQPFAEGGELRYIALDTSGAVEPDELDRTMIHEFAHLVTLREDQVPVDPSTVDECPVYVEDGCPLPDSYLYAFFDAFWPDMTSAVLDEGGDEAADQRFDTGEFVTEYAATIPGEDAAEVFAEWVLADEAPQGDDVIDEKMRFFDDYPELVAIRAGIRDALA